ncbi:MAG: hypothetical protein RLP44_03760 [Aggregatilineales bacterium]
MSENSEKKGYFRQPFSQQERDQLRQMVRFLATVLFFVILASLAVGFFVTQFT